jgi:hypothetical protein
MRMILMCASTHIIGNWSSSRWQKLPLWTCDVIGLYMTLITIPFSLRALRFICSWLHLLFYRLYSLSTNRQHHQSVHSSICSHHQE